MYIDHCCIPTTWVSVFFALEQIISIILKYRPKAAHIFLRNKNDFLATFHSHLGGAGTNENAFLDWFASNYVVDRLCRWPLPLNWIVLPVLQKELLLLQFLSLLLKMSSEHLAVDTTRAYQIWKHVQRKYYFSHVTQRRLGRKFASGKWQLFRYWAYSGAVWNGTK